MQLPGRFSLALVFALFATLAAPLTLAQKAEASFNWHTLAPQGEEFSIEIPKEVAFESGKMPYHRLEVNTRLYLSQPASGPVFAVVSLSGIKSNPAMYTEMERLNSYVDAFKKFLAPRLKGKAAVAKLTFTANKSLNGHAGRVYQMTVGDLSGTVLVYSTRKRFYAAVFLNHKKAEEMQERFLSSLTLPDYVPPTPAETVASQTPKEEKELKPKESELELKVEKGADTKAQPGQPGHTPGETPTEGSLKEEPKTENPHPDTKGAKRPINGGVLNGKALILPRPDYPAEARAAKATGTVTVQLTIDEYGAVIAAQVVAGHPLLHQASLNAAYLARFSPTVLMGEAVKVTGVIVYNFVNP